MRRRAQVSPLTARIGSLRQRSLLHALTADLDAAPPVKRPTPRARAIRRAIVARRRVPIDPNWSYVFAAPTDAEWALIVAQYPEYAEGTL